MNKGLIFVIVLLLLGGIATVIIGWQKGWFASKEQKNKKALVDAIMKKYATKPGFDASPEILITYDVATLQKLLSGEIH